MIIIKRICEQGTNLPAQYKHKYYTIHAQDKRMTGCFAMTFLIFVKADWFIVTLI